MSAIDHRREEVRRLWLERDEASRTGNDVLSFHGWLQANRPDLLPTPKHGHGDAYQYLKSDLAGLIRE